MKLHKIVCNSENKKIWGIFKILFINDCVRVQKSENELNRVDMCAIKLKKRASVYKIFLKPFLNRV